MNRHGGVSTVRQGEQETLCDLLVRTTWGDREAFTTFYQATSQRVYGFIRRIILDPELAQDTTQEIYVMVWLEAHKYDPTIGNAMSWLLTIAHRRAVDRVRSEQAGADREFRWGTANQSAEYDVVAETVADRLEAQKLIRCLRELSPLQREAISLAYLNCLTYREVAAHLSTPPATVKSRIRDGLKQLRTRMEEA